MKNLLVLVAEAVDSERLSRALETEVPEGVKVRVVASPDLSFLQWLTNDEDKARVDATELARRAAGAISGQADVLERGMGDHETQLAAADVLHTADVDEVLLVVAGSGDRPSPEQEALAKELESQFGVPVKTLALPPK